MSSVDDRIVNMEFNNKQFLEGAKQSQDALEGVDRAIQNAGKSKGLSTMEEGVGAVTSKFSAMQVVGVTALATITSKAVSAGVSMLKSLTVDPLLQGFQEYQTNLNSIQTVMSNTGAGVNEVNKYMQKLNHYSDQTIYNFSEMARNIGTFTAAGVDLATATSSIQGIANLAALSGSNSQQASRAMYQLSQAIAAGRVSLQDWNSVVNAGMGGRIFQNALAQTSVAMGQLDEKAISFDKTTKALKIHSDSFRQSISSAGGQTSWLTSGALVNTLAVLDGRFSTLALSVKGYTTKAEQAKKIDEERAKLAKQGIHYTKEQFAQVLDTANKAYEAATVVKTFPQLMQVTKESIGSIFSNSFGILLGNFNQSKRLWTKVSSVITGPGGILFNMSKSITKTLRSLVDYKGFDGRTKVVQGFFRIGRTLREVFGAISGAFNDVFAPSGVSILEKVILAWKEFTKIIRVHHKTAEDLRDILGGVFAVIHIGFSIVVAVAKAFKAFFSGMSEGAGEAQNGILGFLAGIGNSIKAFDKWLTSGNRIEDMMTKIGRSAGKFVGPLVHSVGLVIKAFGQLSRGDTSGFVGLFAKAKTSIAEFASNVAGLLQKVTSPVQSVSDFFGRLKDKIDSVVDSFRQAEEPVKKVSDTFSKVADSGATTFGFGGMSGGSSAGLEAVAEKIGAVGDASDSTKSSVDGMYDTMSGDKSAKAAQNSETIRAAAYDNMSAWDLFKVSMMFVGKAIVDVLTTIGSGVNHVLKQLFHLFDGMDALDFAMLLNTIFSSALILTITNFVNDFSNIGESVTDTMRTMQDGIRANMIFMIAAAIAALALALVLLSLIDPAKMAAALTGVGVMLAMIGGMMFAMERLTKTVKVTNKNMKGEVPTFNLNLVSMAAAMLVIAASILILAGAVAIFGNMDLETLKKGLGAIAISLGILLAAMWVFSKFIKKTGGMAASILVIAIALNLLAISIGVLGTMDYETLGKGIGSLGIMLGIIVFALKGLSSIKPAKLAAAGQSILLISVAFIAMSFAIKKLGQLSLWELAKGLGALALAMALIVFSVEAIAAGGPTTIVAAQSLALLAGAMVAMAYAIQMLGKMTMGQIVKGLIGLAAAMVILLVAAAAAIPLAPGLEALGLAFALVGLGMLAFGTGFALMAAAGVAGIAVLTAGFQAFMLLLPALAISIAAAMVSFIQVFAEAMPKLREAFNKIFEALLGIITDNVDPLADAMIQVIKAILRVIRETVPDFVDTGLTIIEAFLEGLSKHMGDIVTAAGDIVVEFIRGMDDNLQRIIDAGLDFLVHFLEGLGSDFSRIVNAVGDMILDILDAIDRAVQLYSHDISEAGIKIAGHLLSGIASGIRDGIGGVMSEAGGAIKNAAGGLVGLVTRGSAQSKTITQAQMNAVAAALGFANAIQLEGLTDPSLKALAKAANKKQAGASAASVAARVAQYKADKAAKYADKHRKDKEAQKHAKELKRLADKANSTAEIKQKLADDAAQAFQDAKTFAQADDLGKADIKSQKAVALAEQANKLLAQAQQEALEAKELRKKDKEASDKLLKQARNDAIKARNLADDAAAANRAANRYYAAELATRLAALDAEAKAAADQAEYDAADQTGKIAIMQRRAEEDQKKADSAKAIADSLIAQARSLAAINPAESLRLLDQAQEQAQIAKDAADKAQQEREQVEQLVNGSSGSSSTNGAGMQLSRSALEDAAKAVDRQTASLREAEYLAAASTSAVTYEQNIYSPTPLDTPTVYRHSKTLVAAHEIKMGGFPPSDSN